MMEEGERFGEDQTPADGSGVVAQLTAERNRLQMLSRRLVDLQEQERCAVAHELNEEAGQALASIRIGLHLLERGSGNAAVRAQAGELQRTAERLQESLQRLASNLRPPVLDHLGLVAALGQLVEDLSESSGVTVQFEAIGLEGVRLAGRVEIELFRLAQEAVANAILHSRAGQISVVLQRRVPRLRLIVEDDGNGLDSAEEPGRQLGLAALRERVESIGGTFVIERTGSGTTVIAEVPEEL